MNVIESFEKRIFKPVLDISGSVLGNIAYYSAFSAVFVFRFYYTTMFTEICAKPLFLALPYYAGFLVLIAFSGLSILDSLLHSPKSALPLIAIVIVAFLSSVGSGKGDYLLPMCFLIIASKGRDVRPVFILSAILGSVFTFITFFASMNGFIPDLVYKRVNPITMAHAFGMTYRTYFAAHIFFIILYWAIARAERLHISEYLIMAAAGWLTYRYTASRTIFICTAGFLLFLAIELIYHRIKGKLLSLPKCTALVHIAGAIFSFCAVAWWAYITKGDVYSPIKGTLKKRLNYSVQAFLEYPITLFGQEVRQRGAGGIPDKSIPYFILDNIFVRILFMGGVALLILYLCLTTFATYKAVKEQQVILAAALVFVTIDSITEFFAFRLSFNVLLVYCLGYLGSSFPEGVNSQPSKKPVKHKLYIRNEIAEK